MGIADFDWSVDHKNVFRVMLANSSNSIMGHLLDLSDKTSTDRVTRALIAIFRDMVGARELNDRLLEIYFMPDVIKIRKEPSNDKDYNALVRRIRSYWYDDIWAVLPKKEIKHSDIMNTIACIFYMYRFTRNRVSIEEGERMGPGSLHHLEHMYSKAKFGNFNLDLTNIKLILSGFERTWVDNPFEFNVRNTVAFFTLVFLLYNRLQKDSPMLAGMFSELLANTFA